LNAWIGEMPARKNVSNSFRRTNATFDMKSLREEDHKGA
jgi:hypothetical protein